MAVYLSLWDDFIVMLELIVLNTGFQFNWLEAGFILFGFSWKKFSVICLLPTYY